MYKIHLILIVRDIVIVFVPDGDPPNTRTLLPPSDNVPSLVVSV